MLATISEDTSVSRLVMPRNQTFGATRRHVRGSRMRASHTRKSPLQSNEYIAPRLYSKARPCRALVTRRCGLESRRLPALSRGL